MSLPTQTCQVCGRVEVVYPDGRGFPPDIARRKLEKKCHAEGHKCKPVYRPGFDPGLLRKLAGSGEES